MCCLTNASLIIFCVIIFVAMVLTVVAFVTPGWSSVYMTSSNQTAFNNSMLSKYNSQLGLINRLCPQSSDPTQTTDTTMSQQCEAAFNNMEPWEQTTLACMVLTIMLQIASLAYSAFLIYACTCCPCKSTLTLPIIAFAAAGFLLEFIAICVYAGEQNSQNVYASLSALSVSYSALQQQTAMGYSLWLAIGGDVLMLAGTVVAYIAHRAAKVSIIG